MSKATLVRPAGPEEESAFRWREVRDTDVEFARESLLDGWDQAMIAGARVMVVGAGALGNEVLKNLALLGFRRLFIVDMDEIARSNLSRSVLFQRADQGAGKAATAARRVRRLCLARRPQVYSFAGDLTFALGSGVYRRMDIVFGCLDNVAARLATDEGCWLFGVPWVEGGMAGYHGNVTVFVPPDGPCYVCTRSAEDYAQESRRYSCDQRLRRAALSQQIPAVQTVSAIIAATQVQEALKVLQGQRTPRTIMYDGRSNQMREITMHPPAAHGTLPHHPSLVNHPIREIRRLSHDTPLADAVQILREEMAGQEPIIELRFALVVELVCNQCAYQEWILRRREQIWAEEYQACPRCGSEAGGAHPATDTGLRLVITGQLSAASPPAVQMRTLGQLGVPALHILEVRAGGATHYVELTGDLPHVLGRWA